MVVADKDRQRQLCKWARLCRTVCARRRRSPNRMEGMKKEQDKRVRVSAS